MGLVALDAVVARAGGLLMSFNGPVCDLWAVLRHAAVADRLRQAIEERGHAVEGWLRDLDDPMPLLRYALTRDDARLHLAAEDLMTNMEWEAVPNAVPTPGGHEVIRVAHAAGKPVAIASDASQMAIDGYLQRHDLASLVTAVGRCNYSPAAFKPSTWSASLAARLVKVDVNACVFVGFTPLDMRIARELGMRSIGLVTARTDAATLRAAGTDLILGPDGMNLVAESLRRC
ncbi:HAD family hydrolase [Dactylosporangium sp. CA-052675]|uniref:HAD family hydrolase n=1 Tax=Dactylosporangium sp. CA-052675 TaxID=3239927 RepID=UPI003D91C95A